MLAIAPSAGSAERLSVLFNRYAGDDGSVAKMGGGVRWAMVGRLMV